MDKAGFILRYISLAMGAVQGNCAAMAHEGLFAYGTAIENISLNKAAKEAGHSYIEEYSVFRHHKCHDGCEADKAEYHQNLLTYFIIHLT